ncbi:hypothetical protein BdWA1_000710 [Babesia duncani]|uniref:Uncharacterized protein n=1 Tax=Babesia duncani TaxID=323732 RepID=A0AAD9PMT2_9APIC|nr:hypothetical protein BdWA1_000710 [Babesia duncani]
MSPSSDHKDVYFQYSFAKSIYPNFEVLQIDSFKFNNQVFNFESNKAFIYRLRLENVIVYACKDGEQCFKPWLLHLVGFYYDNSSPDENDDVNGNLIRYNYFFKRDGNGTWKSHTFTQSITVKSGSRDTFIYNKIESKPDQEKGEYISQLRKLGATAACGYESRVNADSYGYQFDPDKLVSYFGESNKHKNVSGSEEYSVTSFNVYSGTAPKFEITLKEEVTEQGGSLQEKTVTYYTDEGSYDLTQNGSITTEDLSEDGGSCQAKKAKEALVSISSEKSGTEEPGKADSEQTPQGNSQTSSQKAPVSAPQDSSEESAPDSTDPQSPSPHSPTASTSSHETGEQGSNSIQHTPSSAKNSSDMTSGSASQNPKESSGVVTSSGTGGGGGSEPVNLTSESSKGVSKGSHQKSAETSHDPALNLRTVSENPNSQKDPSTESANTHGEDETPAASAGSQPLASSADAGVSDLHQNQVVSTEHSASLYTSKSSSNITGIICGSVFGSGILIGTGIFIYKRIG